MEDLTESLGLNGLKVREARGLERCYSLGMVPDFECKTSPHDDPIT